MTLRALVFTFSHADSPTSLAQAIASTPQAIVFWGPHMYSRRYPSAEFDALRGEHCLMAGHYPVSPFFKKIIHPEVAEGAAESLGR